MYNILRRNRFFALMIIIIITGISSCKKNETDEPKEILIRYLAGVYPDSTITDGPFISIIGEKFDVRWIEKNNKVVEERVGGNSFDEFEEKFGIPFSYLKSFQSNSEEINYVQEYNDVVKLIAVADIHGQYEIFERLMRKSNVIDENNNWVFGSGHLLINGDVFDRGNRVTESLWLIFKLENQANLVGGKVHLLLGNHEVMVMNNDLRYIDPKYTTNSRRLGTTYDQLYSKNTLMGRWLRTKPVIVRINDMIFNHAGISSEFLMRKLDAEMVNRIFLEDIIDADSETIDNDPLLDFLAGSEGPIWHRGFFRDDDFNLTKTNRVLDYFNSNHIVVGHTTMDHILFRYDQKIINIDCGIKYGVDGEFLICNNGFLSVGTLD